MPYYYRRYPYRRSYWRRGGVGSSQQSGTRRFKLMVPIEGTGSLNVALGNSLTSVGGFQPYYTSNSVAGNDVLKKFANVVSTPLFQTYCKLYDEVKLDSMKLRIAVVKLPAGVSGFKCVTTVDRHCTIDDIFNPQTGNQMVGSAECQTRMFTSLQNAKIYRNIYARDLSERTNFLDSTLGSVDVDGVTRSGIKDFIESGTAWSAFYPIINVVFQLGTAATANDTLVFQFTCQYAFTFRNPKFAVSSVSKSLDFGAKSEDVMEEEPEEKKKKVVIEEENDEDEEELNPLLDESQEPISVSKPVLVKKAGKKS